eukprot:TRINITY_DN35636_c0_g1_i1.p1 TRINITY_DN35636_c0_g1~~TRINITY_DN35636_c0_g1_i1.p1  ORF type:complete len:446 (-),score=47.53 TRINITY_DN35636_c0_g1_i1:412-1749(-)
MALQMQGRHSTPSLTALFVACLIILSVAAPALCRDEPRSRPDSSKDASSAADSRRSGELETYTFDSVPFTLSPGQVYRRFQYLPWVPHRVSIRSFDAEVVDEHDKSVPLSDIYLHHWVILRSTIDSSAQPKAETEDNSEPAEGFKIWPNSGTCANGALSQWFGEGSETRKTETSFVAPFGVETGNTDLVPPGKKEAWFAQIHAIDSRDAEEALACIECRCDSYGVNTTYSGKPLPPGYKGGIYCCYDGYQCALKKGASSGPKTYRMRFTIGYVKWTEDNVPVRMYQLDVTNNGLLGTGNNCQVEYDVEKCTPDGTLAGCVHSKETTIAFPDSGRLLVATGHLHAPGMGVTLWGEDGSLICDSIPIYGRGTGAGDEAGYITGMTSCTFGSPGFPERRIAAGEKLRLRASYDSTREHMGVMGLFIVALVADEDVRVSNEPRAAFSTQ